jgi:DNA-binding LacI/PurR family transcriptional regulator
VKYTFFKNPKKIIDTHHQDANLSYVTSYVCRNTNMVTKHPYEQLAENLASRIKSGEWQEGQRIPGIREFEQIYPYSRVTIQKAIDRLRDQGYIEVSPRSGAYVKSTFVRDQVALLVGGALPDGSRSAFSAVCQAKLSAYLHRSGLSVRVYNDDPHSTLGVPKELDEDLDKGRLKSLLTIQSTFGYRYLLSERWRQQAVAHVDIGAIPTGFRVDVDRHKFLQRALALAKELQKQNIAIFSRGTGLGHEQTLAQYAQHGVSVLAGPDIDTVRDLSREAWGFAAATQIIRSGNIPDALIVADANAAKGIVQAALVHRIDIPDRLNVITLTNKGEDLFFPVPITRFCVDLELMACTAGQMLIDLMREPNLPPRTTLLEPQLESVSESQLQTQSAVSIR